MFLFPSVMMLGRAFQKLGEMEKFMRPKYKSKIIRKLIDYKYDEFQYIENQRIAKSVLIKSKLFPKQIAKAIGENFMKFRIGKTIVMFCETVVLDLRGRQMFKGIFISSTFKKYFQGISFVI